MGLCKHVLGVDDARQAKGVPGVLDRGFIAVHTDGFAAFTAKARATEWEEIEHVSGLARGDLEQAAEVYIAAERVVGVYGTRWVRPSRMCIRDPNSDRSSRCSQLCRRRAPL